MLIASVTFAGAVYAQTTNTTTATTSTTSSSTSSTNGLLGPLLGTPNQNTNLNTVCHNKAVRHELITWYKQLPTDQKNALQSDLKQAVTNWYNQLPSDQQAKLQSIVNQTSQTQ
ncbi:MAG: hypothetical protein ACXV2F_05990 [Halobacteriota archaeon]